MAAVELNELEFGVDFVSGGMTFLAEAYVSIETGEVILYADDSEFDPLPEDISNDEKYLPLPTKQELGLGRSVALEFSRQYLSDDYETVEMLFSGKGAYSHFKELLDRRDLLDAWHKYENQAQRERLVEWCEENEIEIAG